MFFLVIQSTYQSIQLAVCSYHHHAIVEHKILPKHDAALIMQTIDMLLASIHITITDIRFCVVNRGPAPFTTLRSVIATVNGITASIEMPLVAFNNLDTLATEYEHTKVKKIILLNAFAGDFYYWTDTQQGVGKAPYIASIIKAEVIAQIIGNGGPLLRTELTHTNNLLDVQYIDELKDCCSLETAATLGAQRYATGQIEQQYITPLYFKQPLFFIP